MVSKDWGSWLRAPPRKGAGGSKSKCLRDEGDDDWGSSYGKDNHRHKFSGIQNPVNAHACNQECNKHEDTTSIAKNQGLTDNVVNISNLTGHNLFTNLSVGPEEEESLGLNPEERKRRRGEARLHSDVSDCVGRSCGLTIFWKRHVNCQVTGYSNNHIDVVFSEANTSDWRLTCFYGLTELDLHGGKFTWEKSGGTNGWVRERLDRAFATASWWTKFPLCNLCVHHTSCSDHDPIQLDTIYATVSKKVFRFHFENTWLKVPSFIKEVTVVWSDLPAIHLLPKLFSVSSFMARWGKSFFHKFREKVKHQKAIIAQLIDCTDDVSVHNYLVERDKLNELLLHEELYWKQRAKTFWLLEGDENTRFFHKSASAGKKTNHVSFLVNDSGDRIEKHGDMCEVVKHYFSNVFTGDMGEVNSVQTHSPRSISSAQNAKLIEDITFEEFTVAIKQMHPDKASEADCVIIFPHELNVTNVVLIPKKDNANCMKDLRLIALCNILYKTLAKVLANRLKLVLPDVISENQSAFVPGRSVNDNVLVAFEVIHHMKRKSTGSEGEVALKLDMRKAYDRVNWSFLRQRMKVMGFCDKWIDGLSNALDQAFESGGIHGCSVSPQAPVISHLLFADDSFLFFKATMEETTRIKNLLVDYERCSGQSVNFQKSGVYFSSNVRSDKKQELKMILVVHNDIENSKYLGLPFLVGKSKKRVFGFLKERASKRIQGWQAKRISRRGKTILIRNVAQAIPSFWKGVKWLSWNKFDMSNVEFAPTWLLSKLGEAQLDEVWKGAKHTQYKPTLKKELDTQASTNKWSPLSAGQLKVNVDASVFSEADSFSIGMVLRNHHGTLLAGKVLCLPAPVSVFEAEANGIREALSWTMVHQLQGKTVLVETDSLLTVQALHNNTINYLEVGDVIVSCQLQLHHLVGVDG
ncbi:hypothetical protein AgCh_003647 [Apium graveolens]